MSATSPLLVPAQGNPRTTRLIFIILALVLGGLLFAFGKTAFIFCLLIVLLLTGMPVSIALGLTVLTYLFTMTDVPPQSVALKPFIGLENFESMAIPSCRMAGGFLTQARVGRP